MTPKNEMTIKDILTVDDKAKFVDWVRDNIEKSDKCVIVLGTREPETHRLCITGQQIGFEFEYELEGFLNMTTEIFCHGEEDDDAE